jgi:hypothetical protein
VIETAAGRNRTFAGRGGDRRAAQSQRGGGGVALDAGSRRGRHSSHREPRQDRGEHYCWCERLVVLAWSVWYYISGLGITHAAAYKHVAAPTVELSEDDLAKLDALNQAHPYYWCPLPLVRGAAPDV